MIPNQFKANGSDDRQKEFKRQQDRLKMMAPDAERKTVSADDMINSLLQKSDTFKRVSDDLPHWVIADSPLCCQFYESIWNVVRCSDKMVDTNAISQLLLTSGLHPDVLCFIWNLANKTVPGQLTKQELFIVLALVGLAQSNSTFNSLGVLKLVPSAPIPRLHTPFLPPAAPFTRNMTSTFSNSVPMSLAPMPSTTVNSTVLSTSLKQQFPSPVVAQPVAPVHSLHAIATAAEYASPIGLPSPVANISSNELIGSTQQVSSLNDDNFQDFQSVIFPLEPASNAKIVSRPVVSSMKPKVFEQPLSTASLNESTLLDQQFPDLNSLPSSVSTTDAFQSDIDSMTSDLLASSFIDKTFPKVSSFPKHDRTEVQNNVASDEGTLNLDDSFNDFQSNAVDDFSEFQDFQSAQQSADIIQPSKGLVPKLPSFYKVSPESERKLRNLSQPESFSAMPESKISSRNQVSSMPSIAVLGQGAAGYGTSRDVGSRLANHSLGLKSDKNRHHHKHYKIKPIVSGSTPGIPEEMFPKVLSKPPASFLLKETKIPSTELDREPQISELTRSIEIPIVGIFKETTLPVDMKGPAEKTSYTLGDTLISCEAPGVTEDSSSISQTAVDKYSALRDIEDPIVSEDFGEFLSAELTTEKAVEAWNTWNKSVNLPEDSIGQSNEILNKSLQSDFDRGNDVFSVPESETKIIEPSKSIGLLGDIFDAAIPVTPFNEQFLPSSDTVSPFLAMAEQSLEPKDFENSIVFGSENIEEFGDFVGPSVESLNFAPTEDVTSIRSRESLENSEILRDDPLSSFEFSSDNVLSDNIMAAAAPSLDVRSGLEPQEVARKCLECCHRLLKEAVQIFEGVSDKSILKEVLDTREARNYLKYLQIVYRISQRVSLAGNGENLMIENEIIQLWMRLDTVTSENSIPLPELTEQEEKGLPCAVCNGPTSDQDIHQNGLHYHVSCANLWVNCIETSLPCL